MLRATVIFIVQFESARNESKICEISKKKKKKMK